MHPLSKVKIEWSSEFAYAIGLLTTDGCLSKDRRHIDFTSDDIEQLRNLMRCLGIEVKIGHKTSGFTATQHTRIQFGDVNFYKFLLDIGLMPAKSKIIGSVHVPDPYFFDFLRGHFDGDGSFYSYWDWRWRSSFMFYTSFTSASLTHIEWLRAKVLALSGLRGHISRNHGRSNTQTYQYYQLRYAKQESITLLKRLYSPAVICLSRKRLKVQRAFAIIGKHLD